MMLRTGNHTNINSLRSHSHQNLKRTSKNMVRVRLKTPQVVLTLATTPMLGKRRRQHAKRRSLLQRIVTEVLFWMVSVLTIRRSSANMSNLLMCI